MMALQQDQVDGYNNLLVEVIFCQLQTIEFSYADEGIRRQGLEKQQTFEVDSTAIRARRRVAKNLCKAREERELQYKNGGGKGA